MSGVSNTIYVSASSFAKTENDFRVIGGVRPKEHKEDKSIAQSYEQTLIDDFKEQNSPENNKINQIYGKFLGGKELSPDELQYLAKHSPQLYKEVCGIMQERRALEQRMKQAETKEQVTEAGLNAVAGVKSTMGTGEQAKLQARKTMARANQLSSAYVRYTASIDYKNKEDAKTQAEDMRAKLDELEAELIKQQEEINDSLMIEAESDSLSGEESQTSQTLQTSEISEKPQSMQKDSASNSAKDVFDVIKEQERRRRKRKIRQKSSSGGETEPAQNVGQLNIDYESLWKKTKELYQSSSTPTQKSGDIHSSETGGYMNVSL
ncbi:MAG: hypothetical protein J5981_00390 [Lachnospira sp.]|nr:hypothetical protein [Lachnospira sp.]